MDRAQHASVWTDAAGDGGVGDGLACESRGGVATGRGRETGKCPTDQDHVATKNDAWQGVMTPTLFLSPVECTHGSTVVSDQGVDSSILYSRECVVNHV